MMDGNYLKIPIIISTERKMIAAIRRELRFQKGLERYMEIFGKKFSRNNYKLVLNILIAKFEAVSNSINKIAEKPV